MNIKIKTVMGREGRHVRVAYPADDELYTYKLKTVQTGDSIDEPYGCHNCALNLLIDEKDVECGLAEAMREQGLAKEVECTELYYTSQKENQDKGSDEWDDYYYERVPLRKYSKIKLSW